jgi:hypothetical protein
MTSVAVNCRKKMQEPERGHSADTDSDDHDCERDGRAEENALHTVQLPVRSRHR